MSIKKDISKLKDINNVINILERKKKETIQIINDDFRKILNKYVKEGKALYEKDNYIFNEGVMVTIHNAYVNLDTIKWENGTPKYPLYSIIKEQNGKMVCFSKNVSGMPLEQDISKFGPDVKSFINECCK